MSLLLRLAASATLLFVSASGCIRQKTTAEPVAIAAIENLGGRIEPLQPTPGRPVFRVTLSNTGVRDEHLQYLDAFPALNMLSLAHTDVTDAGVVHLKRLRNLKRLSLTDTHVTPAGMRELREALPQLQIQRLNDRGQ